MEIGIVGLPQTGKKTLFNLLTGGGSKIDSAFVKTSKDPGVGISRVHDSRLDALATLYNPRKLTPATIKYILLPKLSKNSEENQAAFTAIQNVDAVCHVVRCFRDESVFHIDGSIDAFRDISFLEAELILNDLVFTERRIERLDKEMKRKNDPALKKERVLMDRIAVELNNEIPLRMVCFTDEEVKIINAYPYLSRKNMLVVLNMSDDELAASGSCEEFYTCYAAKGVHFCAVSCKIEEELAEIEDTAERTSFLNDLGIDRSALEKITQLSYRSLERISFFTVGEDEVRAWTIRKGECAQKAGGVIHSDIERGFIRAEHMRVEDLISLKNEQAVKEAGKFSLKGKEYCVEDGDILHFRFNV